MFDAMNSNLYVQMIDDEFLLLPFIQNSLQLCPLIHNALHINFCILQVLSEVTHQNFYLFVSKI